ncbi:MAG TPA: bifunctional tRNA (5-methylaminomethyl-2-thiouridine)(34)-methyltransferase MnmD/FAD-dependent 5-carboxymethylaminomethyl-2-thiouridine(34) oxidoreductase MnmC, partial [Alphaproteobacteria bacterium]
MVLRSQQFDDIYFSVEDGLAETKHVFLDGNDLPEAWQGSDRFCVGELGFGTGLNILSVWKLFEETAKHGQRLDIISIEKYPLSKAQIAQALEIWKPQLGTYLGRLIECYP